MGEVAEMMLEGDICAWCGVLLGCEGFGIPILCHECHLEAPCDTPIEGMLCERFYQ